MHQQKIVLSIFEIQKYAFNVIIFLVWMGVIEINVCVFIPMVLFLWLKILINFDKKFENYQILIKIGIQEMVDIFFYLGF